MRNKFINLILIFLFFLIKETLANTIHFFPEFIKTNWRNNRAFLFESNFFTEQKKIYVVHKGMEGFQILLKQPIINKNHIFEIKNQCHIIEGKFFISLLIKNKSKKIIDIPFKIDKNVKYLEENPEPYNIYIDKSKLIQYLKSNYSDLSTIMDVEIHGIKIIPFTSRIAFYCNEFKLIQEKFFVY